MPIRIERIPDAPIMIVYSLVGQGDVKQEASESITEITAALDAEPGPVYMITDMTLIKLGLDDLVAAASLAARGEGNLMQHPNLLGRVFVMGDGMLKMAVRGLNSATFGQVKAEIFDSVEEAVEYCRAKLKERNA